MKIMSLGNLLELLFFRPSLHVAINSPRTLPIHQGKKVLKHESQPVKRGIPLRRLSSLLDFLREFSTFLVCSFCGQDVKSLRHDAWRCMEKLKKAEKAENVPKDSSNLHKSTLPIAINETTEVSNCSNVKCFCGKLCNGLCGLKMHQRSCRVITGLMDETFEVLEETKNIDTSQNLDSAHFDAMHTEN